MSLTISVVFCYQSAQRMKSQTQYGVHLWEQNNVITSDDLGHFLDVVSTTFLVSTDPPLHSVRTLRFFWRWMGIRRTIIINPNFGKIITSPIFSKIIITSAFGKIITTPIFGKIITTSAFGKIIIKSFQGHQSKSQNNVSKASKLNNCFEPQSIKNDRLYGNYFVVISFFKIVLGDALYIYLIKSFCLKEWPCFKICF